LAIFLTAVVLFSGGIFAWKKYHHPEEDTRPIYEAMIQTKGQDEYRTDEDKKTFFENGDAIVIFPQGHIWSNGEKGELIVKLKITVEEAEKLMESETTEAKSDASENNIIRLRKYRIKLNKIDYDPEELQEKVLENNVIEEK
jgi:Fe-S-cluster formation regulator IscX/YfhJ